MSTLDFLRFWVPSIPAVPISYLVISGNFYLYLSPSTSIVSMYFCRFYVLLSLEHFLPLDLTHLFISLAISKDLWQGLSVSISCPVIGPLSCISITVCLRVSVRACARACTCVLTCVRTILYLSLSCIYLCHFYFYLCLSLVSSNYLQQFLSVSINLSFLALSPLPISIYLCQFLAISDIFSTYFFIYISLPKHIYLCHFYFYLPYSIYPILLSLSVTAFHMEIMRQPPLPLNPNRLT